MKGLKNRKNIFRFSIVFFHQKWNRVITKILLSRRVECTSCFTSYLKTLRLRILGNEEILGKSQNRPQA